MTECTCDWATGECQAPVGCKNAAEVERLTERCAAYKGQVEVGANAIERLRAGLEAAIRAANLALFVVRKQDVMPNDSWKAGFEKDMATASAAYQQLAAPAKEE